MYEVVVIGGGPSGMAAALGAKEIADKVAIIERSDYLGGILPQCIHNGFGTRYLNKDLTGPEFSDYLERKVRKEDIDIFLGAHVSNIKKTSAGIFRIVLNDRLIESKTVVFATGCKEKTRYSLNIPGDRPSGVFTAGTAQALMDIYGYLPGKKVVILGSGDIGLIVARRFAMEGAEVIGVYEINSFPGGLPRNIVQCLQDFDIPIYLNSTILEIKGKKRVEGVVIGKIKDGKIVNREFVKCDTVIISAGLVPNTKLLLKMGAEIDPNTGGPMVNEYYETSIEGAFASGNLLVVNDLVDYAVEQGEIAGKNAALRSRGLLKKRNFYRITPGQGIKFAVPQMISGEVEVKIAIRVTKYIESGTVVIGDLRKKVIHVNPSTMFFLKIPPGKINSDSMVMIV